MNKLKNLKIENNHLTEQELLMLVDGELSSKEAANAREHLETCWSCRAELEKIEETISTFVEFRKKVQIPLNPLPPNNWTNFNRKLNEIKREETKSKRKWFNFANLSPFQLRLGIASIAALVIAALFLQLVTVEKVSASKLLDKSAKLQNEKVNSTSQPVTYQKLKVRFDKSETIDWEVWNDAKNSRSKQKVSSETIKESADVLQELTEILQKNKMSPQKPLSPESFKSWYESVADKTEEITENETVALKTINHKITFDGQISEASIKFRLRDFHPFEQTLKVRTGAREKTFEIYEVDFEVVSLNNLKPNFFDETPVSTEIVKKVSAGPRTLTVSTTEEKAEESEGLTREETVEESPGSTESKTPNSVKPPKITATTDLEVEVLHLLNNAGADLGEEINVKLENGILYIRGLVESPERKKEILHNLQSVRQNPAVRIQLETISEAVAKQKKQPANKPTTVDSLETKTLNSAAQSDLVEHFGSEAEAKRFASSAINRSSQAMSHVYAMRRLAKQFPTTELKNLSPEAKMKWFVLIASHARKFAAINESLAQDLRKVFNVPGVSGSANTAVNSFDDLPQAIENLFGIASGNDRLIRSALTISANDSQLSALKTVQFHRSLQNAEALAKEIASVK